jgi:hypothetical protein
MNPREYFTVLFERSHVEDIPWATIINSVFGAVFIASLAWSGYIFMLVSEGRALDASAVKSLSPVDRASLDTAHAVFESRALEETKYRTGVYQYRDPSQ